MKAVVQNHAALTIMQPHLPRLVHRAHHPPFLDSRSMRHHCFVAFVAVLFAVATSQSVLHAQTFVDPEKAMSDPDFLLQGEYVDSKRGLQAIAMGDGEFQVVTYNGGLPGAGWDGKDKQTIDVEADTLEAMLTKFKRVTRQSPTIGAKPPSGAVVLFDGTRASLDQHWQKGAKMTEDGLLQQGCRSADLFGDYSMHLEFRTPYKPKARGQGRGNSGLYHQGRYETQILDSFGLEGKMNETGGIYSIREPDVNMCLPPLTWQTYDVQFTAARFDDSGKKTANAKITVQLNGIVIHRDVELPKSTTAAPVKQGPEDGPIYLQDHGNPVMYRNIWVQPRDVEAEAIRPIVPGFERFHVNSGDPVEGGKLLLGELNCVACHKTNQSLVNFIKPKQAPILDKVGQRIKPEWLLRYIANPHTIKPGTTMPDLMAGMNEAERTEAAVALTNFLVGSDQVTKGGKNVNSKDGEKLFHESGCVACHMPRDGRAANTATSFPLPEMGDKYSRESLLQFLKNPLAVRPSGRMPRLQLSDDDFRKISQYLTGDTSVAFNDKRDLPKEPNMRFTAYYKSVDQLPKNLDAMTPDKSGVSRGLDISAGERNENVIISFRGFLPIKQSGKYSFRIGSDDGSVLYINGKKILDNDGVHGVEYRETSIQLGTGLHPIRVDFFEKGGGEELSLAWAGPGVQSGGIDRAIVMNNDGSAVIQEPEPSQVDPNVFVFDETKVEKGRQLFSLLGCASCHVRMHEGDLVVSPVTGPALSAARPGHGCLGDAANGVPNYDLIGGQKDALNAALTAAAPSGPPTPDRQLAHTMKSLNCYACHKRDGIGGNESDRDQFFVSTIPEMGDEGRLAPPLNGVGDKLRKEWIQKVITDGEKMRPYMKTFMPHFGDKNASHLAGVFAKLDRQTGAKIVQSDEPKARQVAVGRKLVGSKGLACVSCHTYGKFKSSGIQAIALDTMASRIREDWFHRYLPDPQRYRPGTRMPTGFPDGNSTVKDIYDGDQAKQLSAMWTFLSNGTKGGVPEGIIGGKEELKPDDKPIIYRNFIEGVSPRGIAVGYPEKANLCWDANNMSLALIWQDRFIDASKHWQGRGQGNQVPLGGSITPLEKVSPIAVLADTKAAWPTDPPKQRGYRFLGYRLDQDGRPTFRYQVAGVEIQDKPIPQLGDLVSTFKRQITIQPLDGQTIPSGLHFRAAAGNNIVQTGGAFVIDDTLTIRVNAEAMLRNVNGGQEVLVPITKPTAIIQDIVW